MALDGKIAAADVAEAKILRRREYPQSRPSGTPLRNAHPAPSRPARGFRLQAQDRAGLLTLDMRINLAASTYNAQLSYQFNDQATQVRGPGLALCNALVAGEHMAIATLDGQILALGFCSSPLNWLTVTATTCAKHASSPKYKNGQELSSRCRSRSSRHQYWMDYASKLLRGEDVPQDPPGQGSTAQSDCDQARFFLQDTTNILGVHLLQPVARKPSSSLVARYPSDGSPRSPTRPSSIISANSGPGTHSGGDGRIEVRLAPAVICQDHGTRALPRLRGTTLRLLCHLGCVPRGPSAQRPGRWRLR